MSANHKTVPAQVWVDVDEGIADAVRHLNTIAGVRTFASCQGSIDGAAPYQPYVMAHWPTERKEEIEKHFTIGDVYDTWGYLHPKDTPPWE